MGVGYNNMPEELWDLFQQHRPAGYQHEKPALVHWEYGKEDQLDDDGNKVKGYWCADDMVHLCHEFADLFDFLYGRDACGTRHTMLLNMDWSGNHSAKPADACVVTNFNVHWGGRVDKPLVKVTHELFECTHKREYTHTHFIYSNFDHIQVHTSA